MIVRSARLAVDAPARFDPMHDAGLQAQVANSLVPGVQNQGQAMLDFRQSTIGQLEVQASIEHAEYAAGSQSKIVVESSCIGQGVEYNRTAGVAYGGIAPEGVSGPTSGLDPRRQFDELERDCRRVLAGELLGSLPKAFHSLRRAAHPEHQVLGALVVTEPPLDLGATHGPSIHLEEMASALNPDFRIRTQFRVHRLRRPHDLRCVEPETDLREIHLVEQTVGLWSSPAKNVFGPAGLAADRSHEADAAPRDEASQSSQRRILRGEPADPHEHCCGERMVIEEPADPRVPDPCERGTHLRRGTGERRHGPFTLPTPARDDSVRVARGRAPLQGRERSRGGVSIRRSSPQGKLTH